MGKCLIVKVLHEVNSLLQGDPHKWLSSSQITQYQGLLCGNPHVTIKPCQALNLAILILWEKVGPHMIARKYASRPDLRDQPIPDPDLVLYTNGTSLVKQGQRLSGYAVVMEETITDASSLPSHWSTQGAELYALIWALQLSRVKIKHLHRLQVCFCHTTCTQGSV